MTGCVNTCGGVPCAHGHVHLRAHGYVCPCARAQAEECSRPLNNTGLHCTVHFQSTVATSNSVFEDSEVICGSAASLSPRLVKGQLYAPRVTFKAACPCHLCSRASTPVSPRPGDTAANPAVHSDGSRVPCAGAHAHPNTAVHVHCVLCSLVQSV